MDHELVAKVRAIIRKDLDSVGMIPTAIAVQMAAEDDQALSFALLIEAVYVRMFNGRDHADITAYLRGPMRVQGDMPAYVIASAVRVREVFRKHQGKGKHTLLELLQDKGAEERQIKLLINSCHQVGTEYGIALERRFALEDEVAQHHAAGGPQTSGISTQEAQERIARLTQLLRADPASPIPADLLPTALLNADTSDATEEQVIELLFRHCIARSIQGWYGVAIRQELRGRLALPAEPVTVLLSRAGSMIAMVRRLGYDLPIIETGIRQLTADPRAQQQRIAGARVVVDEMQRAGVRTLAKFRNRKPFWPLW